MLIVDQDNEEIRILLNPLYVIHEQLNSKLYLKVNGIPHGDRIVLELSSSLFTKINYYELNMMNLNEELIIRLNTALEWNYFSSVY